MRAARCYVGIAFVVFLAAGCSKPERTGPPDTMPHSLASGYEVYLTGGDTVHHDLGAFELWHKRSDGKHDLVWPYLGDEQRVFGEMIVFNSGARGDRRFPALFAYQPSGKPVDITECVTEYYCRTNGVNYGSMRDNLRYIVRAGRSQETVDLLGMRTDWSPPNLQSILLSVPVSEITNWYKQGLSNGVPMQYEKIDYRFAELRSPAGRVK